jgi:hypothetical protein
LKRWDFAAPIGEGIERPRLSPSRERPLVDRMSMPRAMDTV